MPPIITTLIFQLKIALVRVVVAVIGSAAASYAQTYYLGVLAPQGESAAQQRWQPWIDELNNQLIDNTVVLVPLALQNWQEQIEAQQFALVLGPQVQFIKMDTTGWRWLATLQTNEPQDDLLESQKALTVQGKSDKPADYFKTSKKQSTTVTLANELNELHERREFSAMEEVASALWVHKNSSIYQLQDLKMRKIAAVDEDAFGGYLLIAHLLQRNRVPPTSYQTQLVGYPIERTLSTLASGSVDAAIAPLCLMEEMAYQGKIDQSQYRLIHPLPTPSKCQSSTKIYPNWTLAATDQAPTSLISQINQNLFMPDTNSNIAVSHINWSPPESGADAERILYEMNQHPSQKQLSRHIVDWIYAHRFWVVIIALIVVISTINYGWMSWLAWRRQRQILEQNRLIRDYDNRLKQSERFAVIGEMSGSIAHEINQPLATIQNYAQGLLIRSQNTSTNKEGDQQYKAEQQTTENALQQIVTESTRVAGVIGNIRRRVGQSQADDVWVNIADTYQRCILLLGEKAVDISFWYASDYQQLQLPSLLLDQLLLNTMLNSQQQGAAHIMLRCQISESDRHCLVLQISDDAGGFDESRLMISQSSQLASQTRSTKPKGLGLGLMICQRLCKSMGGTMQLDNIEVQQKLSAIKAEKDSYQQRLKRTLNSTAQLVATNNKYPLSHKIGAQVSFYLPLPAKSANVKDTDINNNNADT